MNDNAISVYFTTNFIIFSIFSVKISVIVIVTRGEQVRQLMLHAYNSGRINGDYAMLTVQLFSGNDWHSGDYNWKQVNQRYVKNGRIFWLADRRTKLRGNGYKNISNE